jgi:hypothetical protein
MANASSRPVTRKRFFLVLGLLLVVFATALFLFPRKKNPEWLGQNRYGSVFAPVCANMQNSSRDFAITLNVAYGREIRIPRSRNFVVTCEKGLVVRAVQPRLLPDRKYLIGEIRLKEQYGTRVAVCDLEITDGPLKGAVVHLRDEYTSESIPDPYFSYFEIPSELNLPSGPVPFRIVGWLPQ